MKKSNTKRKSKSQEFKAGDLIESDGEIGTFLTRDSRFVYLKQGNQSISRRPETCKKLSNEL